MYIENVTLKSVPADSLVLPVEEGTILTKNGTVPADLSQAYGIVPQKITNIPPTKRIYLAVAGTIDLKLNNVSFTEEEMQALGKDFNFVPGDEGGGNPNRVQTITGTLADPWGDVGFDALYEALPLYNNDNSIVVRNATAIMLIDGTELGMGVAKLPLHSVIDSNSTEFIIGDGFSFVTAGFLACESGWERDGLYSAYVISGSSQDNSYTDTDVKEYASLIPTTLTIIWHPLPDQS